jgi:hypothetical protein
MRKVRYRCLQSSWGVAIDLVAELKQIENIDTSDTQSHTELKIELPKNFTQFYSFIKIGIDEILNSFPIIKSRISSMVFIVIDINYNPCDFQPEGLACAVASWYYEEFELNFNPISLQYNKQDRKYEIVHIK